jgi:hypothetical protein
MKHEKIRQVNTGGAYDGHPQDLLDEYAQLTNEEVKTYCRSYYEFGNEIAVENLKQSKN